MALEFCYINQSYVNFILIMLGPRVILGQLRAICLNNELLKWVLNPHDRQTNLDTNFLILSAGAIKNSSGVENPRAIFSP